MKRVGPRAAGLLCVLAASTSGQSLVFEKTIDAPSPFITAEWGYAVRSTTDGGLVAAGFTATDLFPLIDDMFLVRTDAQGDTLWTARFGGPGDDGARDVLEAPGGGFALLGMTQSFSSSADLYLVRTDALGNELWSRTYGGPRIDTGDALCAMPAGGWLLVGTAADTTGELDVLAVRVDDQGTPIWQRRYGGAGRDGAAGVCALPQGGAVITGFTSDPGLFDAFLLAIDANGDSLWSRTYGGSQEDWGSSVTPTQDGGLFVAGTTDAAFAAGFSGRAWALRTDAAGVPLWERRFGTPGTSDTQVNGGQQTADGRYVIAGSQISAAGDLDVFVARVDADGDSLWSRSYDRGSTTDHGAGITVTPDGAFVVTGYSHDLDTWYDLYLAKIRDDAPTGVGNLPLHRGRSRVHPNPFVSSATIDLDPLPGVRRWQLVVYDAAGRRVHDQIVDNGWRARLERSTLPAGSYLYRICTEAGAVSAGKLTVGR